MKIPRRRFMLGCLLAAVALQMTPAAESPGAAASAPTIIFIVRNAKQVPGSGTVLPLTEEGRARAEVLANMLEPAGISAIFSSHLSWTQETVAPLAARRKLQTVVIPLEELDRLVAELGKLAPGSVALVGHQGGIIPRLIEKLTGVKGPPVKDHDQLFVVTRQPGGVATMAELRY